MKYIFVFVAGVAACYVVMHYPNETKSKLQQAKTATVNAAQAALDQAKKADENKQ